MLTSKKSNSPSLIKQCMKSFRRNMEFGPEVTSFVFTLLPSLKLIKTPGWNSLLSSRISLQISMQLILPKSSQKRLPLQLASPDTQDPINLNRGPTSHIHHKKNEMLLWNLPAPLKAAISNEFFPLRSKISALNMH